MDGYNYPDSGSSSPRSLRDVDPNPSDASSFDGSSSAHLPSYKLKFMVSYGGKIQPRPHDNHLTYLGGETKLLSVDRHVSLPSLLSRLSSISPDIHSPVSSFKYQLPGEELDSLISVSSDDDLLHLFLEYDRLLRSSTTSKPPRMRLFLFPPSSSASSGQQLDVQSPDCDQFIHALNSVPSAPRQPLKDDGRSGRGGGANSMDFLSGFEKEMLGSGFRQDLVQSEREVAADRGLDPAELQQQLQLMQLRGGGQDSVAYGRKIEASMNVGGGIGGYGVPTDFYAPKIAEKSAPVAGPQGQQVMQAPPAAHTGYWQEKQMTSVGYVTTRVAEQPMYVIPGHPAGGNIYQQPPPQAQMVRPVGGGSGHGYYAVPQRLPQEIYREHQQPQQMYSILPQSIIQPQAQFTKAAAGEGVGMARTSATVGGGVVDATNYRQVMYAATAGSGVEGGKVVGKLNQNSF
ncbi:hypothetical protein MLD38_032150 [Melastoma candidum]|uniref:Uncharacterized protein n=1 Tax=Melastoma candidum TaxID=119954 RepID=A0ACB9M2Q9_9MYRT|nr:hypothetical protein MLD38_032150 [Melastoma candidum]